MAALKARAAAALSPSALRFAGRVIKCYVDKQTGHVRSLRLGWSNELCADTTLDNSEIVALHVPATGSVAALPANVTGDGAVGSLTFQVSGPYSEEAFTCGTGRGYGVDLLRRDAALSAVRFEGAGCRAGGGA